MKKKFSSAVKINGTFEKCEIRNSIHMIAAAVVLGTLSEWTASGLWVSRGRQLHHIWIAFMCLLGLKACELINTDLKQAIVLILFRNSNIAAPCSLFLTNTKQKQRKNGFSRPCKKLLWAWWTFIFSLLHILDITIKDLQKCSAFTAWLSLDQYVFSFVSFISVFICEFLENQMWDSSGWVWENIPQI